MKQILIRFFFFYLNVADPVLATKKTNIFYVDRKIAITCTAVIHSLVYNEN